MLSRSKTSSLGRGFELAKNHGIIIAFCSISIEPGLARFKTGPLVCRSIIPEAFKASWAELHVPGGVPDLAVAKVGLDQPQVGAAFGEVVATGMAETVWVNVEGLQPGAGGDALDHELHAPRGEWAAPLGGEDETTGL